MMLPEAAFTFQFWTSFIIYYYNRMKQLIWPGARLLQAELHQHRSDKRQKYEEAELARVSCWDLELGEAEEQ